MSEWRDIPGYGGRYQISDQGQVRSMYFANELRRKPLLLKSSRRADGSYVLHLTDDNGRGHQHTVTKLMAVTYLGMKWESKSIAYCKNGMKSDLALENIGICDRKHLNRNGTNRRTVRKVCTKTGESLEAYGTVKEAAAKNYISVSALTSRLKGRSKQWNEAFYFEYDTDVRGYGEGET